MLVLTPPAILNSQPRRCPTINFTLGARTLLNKKGMAVFEMIPILVVFILLLSFSFGFFGVIQTSLLNSMAARNYTFETFRHRSDLIYFKDTTDDPEALKVHFDELHIRHHAIQGPMGGDRYEASERPIDKFGVVSMNVASKGTHNSDVRKLNTAKRNSTVGVDKVWVRPAYGICLDAKCDWQN